MRQKIEEIEGEVSQFLEFVRKEFFEGKDDEFEARRNALVRLYPDRIVKIDRSDD